MTKLTKEHLLFEEWSAVNAIRRDGHPFSADQVEYEREQAWHARDAEIADLKRQITERDAELQHIYGTNEDNARLLSEERGSRDAYVQEKVAAARFGERELCKTVFDILAKGTPGAARNSIWEEDRDLFDTFTAGIDMAVDRAVLEESAWWMGGVQCSCTEYECRKYFCAYHARLAANRDKVKPAGSSIGVNNAVPPICPIHQESMVLCVYDRPGSPPGNGWVCQSCMRHQTATPADAPKEKP